ncbi:MAG TPA: MarR family transcriptional regulator [Candidatus Sphingobacterium stercoripullorum]|nr:MarR family transcriptional regulator [Candidatus Sphingobacterium stercoripullorum]
MKIKEATEIAKIAELMEVMRDIRKALYLHFSQKVKEYKFDVTMEMLEVLYVLWNKDNVNQQEIVDKTNRNKASLTSLIDNLTNRGLVERKPDPTDRRNNLIVLTEQGRSYQEKLIPILDEVYQSFQVDISAEEMSNTVDILNKMRNRIND